MDDVLPLTMSFLLSAPIIGDVLVCGTFGEIRLLVSSSEMCIIMRRL